MSIQYVQVKVDTTGLFQPVSMAQGVVGIAGVATAAKGFDQRAQLFTQPLTGAPGEPYIRSVRVILINENNEPLDAASPPTPLGGPANARVNSLGQQSTTTNKVAVKGLKINAKGQFVGEDTDDNKLIKTDPATNRPIKFDGTQYELTLDWFPAKEPAAQPPSNPKLGVPVDGNGRPIANIRMNDDGKFTSLDGNTEYKPDPATGYPLRPASGNQPPELITNLDFGLSQLAKSINLALVNGALRVWAYRLNQGENVDNAFTDFVNRQINIVCLSKMTDGPSITKLKDHVTNASPNDAGGGGTRPRIGVAMLPKGSPISGKTSTILADFGINWTSSRMVLVAHNSDDDVAAAVAGTIARYDPWISLVLKEVISITQSESLSDSEIEKWLDPEGLQGIAQARVNPIVDPEFLAGAGLVMGEGYTADGTGQRLYIDIVRTIDDLAFRLKAHLTNPNVIGTMRINRPGLTGLRTLVSALLDSRVSVGEIDGYTVDIPLMSILQKDPAQRTPEERQQLNTVQNSRRLEFSISVDYSGAIHYLIVTLKLV